MSSGREKLIASYMAEEPVDEKLLDACRDDVKLLEELAELTAIERLLVYHAEEESKELFTAEVAERLRAEEGAGAFAGRVSDRLKDERPRTFSFPRWAKYAAAAAAIVVLAVLPSAPVARITNTAAAVWSGMPAGTSELKRGLVTLDSGFTEMALNNGVVILLEGPAKIDLKSADRVVLHHGKLVAKVPENAIGFRVDTPSSEVVDLGTVFGVSVDAAGASEVHVIEGKVKARKGSRGSYVDLAENQARRFDNLVEQIQTIESDPDRFMRTLPGKSAEMPRFVHWSFDEGEGAEAFDAGSMDRKYGADLKSTKEGGAAPKWSNGQFGKGLYFNGTTAYGITDFPGIGENKPRTVACWVKVPEPEEMRNVFGLVSWGSMKAIGSAWQISINPWEEQGTLGALRIGTREAQAVGTTDLRDNRWHHIAVVMYGGDEADVSTHILLYLDGKLEKTSLKSIHRIDTDIESSQSRAVMFGRNMGYPLDDSKVQGGLFKGWLDEVHIFDAALTHEQVNGLMTRNSVKEG